MTGLAFPKPRPAALEREDRRKARKSADELESIRVRKRSGGRCEVVEHVKTYGRVSAVRCKRRANQIHHMLGGWGRRARGPSLLMEHKQHVCAECHDAITRHILKREGGDPALWTDTYERAR